MDRKQFVKLRGLKSKVVDIPSAIPQGGHLSRLLFGLFVNGIKK